MIDLSAPTDRDLRWLTSLFELYVAKADSEGRRGLRNFWRALHVEIVLEQERRSAQMAQADQMILEALGVEGPVNVTWTPRPDLNWNGTPKQDVP